MCAGKHLKPYQGLKHCNDAFKNRVHRRKTPKTLSGIETNGLKLTRNPQNPSRKTPKTLSGIETHFLRFQTLKCWRRKTPKTLSGIETEVMVVVVS